MPISRNELKVTWGAAASISVPGNGNETSDLVVLDPTTINAQISIKANNSGAPAGTDQLYVWLLQTSGDPDGAGADEFDTYESAFWFAILDTTKVDPVNITAQIPIPQKGFVLYAEGITAGTSSAIVVSATITEQKAT